MKFAVLPKLPFPPSLARLLRDPCSPSWSWLPCTGSLMSTCFAEMISLSAVKSEPSSPYVVALPSRRKSELGRPTVKPVEHQNQNSFKIMYFVRFQWIAHFSHRHIRGRMHTSWNRNANGSEWRTSHKRTNKHEMVMWYSPVWRHGNMCIGATRNKRKHFKGAHNYFLFLIGIYLPTISRTGMKCIDFMMWLRRLSFAEPNLGPKFEYKYLLSHNWNAHTQKCGRWGLASEY